MESTTKPTVKSRAGLMPAVCLTGKVGTFRTLSRAVPCRPAPLPLRLILEPHSGITQQLRTSLNASLILDIGPPVSQFKPEGEGSFGNKIEKIVDAAPPWSSPPRAFRLGLLTVFGAPFITKSKQSRFLRSLADPGTRAVKGIRAFSPASHLLAELHTMGLDSAPPGGFRNHTHRLARFAQPNHCH
ncbi:hypothetical protein VTK26DRAFT_3379 [Humicola hyalothermophila]